jgi:hypothetical protein
VTILQMGKRLGAFGTAVAIVEGSNHLFDYVVAPALIWWLGPMNGGIAFFISALVLNYVVVVWYKKTNTDWFGMEWLRLQEDASKGGLAGKFVKSFLRKTRPLAYIGLCIYDPIYGFIYLRGRVSGSSFSRKDWFWFMTSNLIGILFWISLVSVGIEAMKSIF